MPFLRNREPLTAYNLKRRYLHSAASSTTAYPRPQPGRLAEAVGRAAKMFRLRAAAFARLAEMGLDTEIGGLAKKGDSSTVTRT